MHYAYTHVFYACFFVNPDKYDCLNAMIFLVSMFDVYYATAYQSYAKLMVAVFTVPTKM